jgi:hypothetical protein
MPIQVELLPELESRTNFYRHLEVEEFLQVELLQLQVLFLVDLWPLSEILEVVVFLLGSIPNLVDMCLEQQGNRTNLGLEVLDCQVAVVNLQELFLVDLLL